MSENSVRSITEKAQEHRSKIHQIITHKPKGHRKETIRTNCIK